MEQSNAFAIHWDEPPLGFLAKVFESFDPPRINVYLASAMTGRTEGEATKDDEVRRLIKQVLEEYDFAGLTFQVYDPAEHTKPGSAHSPEEIYRIDHRNTSSADMVVFYLNSPSLGAGMEAQIAADAAVPRVVVYEKATSISRMFLGVFNPTLTRIEFGNLDDLQDQLSQSCGDIMAGLYTHTLRRREAVAGIEETARDMRRFIFTERLVRGIPIEKFAALTGIQVDWLKRLEIDPKVCVTLTMVQLGLIAAVLEAELDVSEHGFIKMKRGRDIDLPRVAKESLENLCTFVQSQSRPLPDGAVFEQWNMYWENDVKPEKQQARAIDRPLSVEEWKERFDRPTLFNL